MGWRRFTAAVAAALAAVLVVGCTGSDSSNGGDEETAETRPESPVVATVLGDDITAADVEELANDGAFLDVTKLESPDGDVAASATGRVVLARLIQQGAIAATLEQSGIVVSDETLAEARDAVDPDGTSELSERAREVLETGLAQFLTLDRALRDGSDAPLLTAAGLFEQFPALTAKHCGPTLAVQPDAADAVTAQLTAGVSLNDVAVPTGLVAATNQGFSECALEAGIPAAARQVTVGVPDGQITTATIRRTANGELVTVFAAPVNAGTGDAVDIERATTGLDERLRASGHAAWWDVVAPQLAVEVDENWGQWSAAGQLVDDATTAEAIIPTATTTTTTVPTTTAAPPTTAAPALAPGLAEQLFAVQDPGTGDLQGRGQAALVSAVPAPWLAAVPVQFGVISGTSSLSYADGRLDLGTYHLSGPWDRLQAVSAHEFGHHIAFRYGTQSELGAAPAGWPISGSTPVERWADCVARSFSGYELGSHSQSPCDGESLDWATVWLAVGPDAHPRTG